MSAQPVTGCALADWQARYIVALRLRADTAGSGPTLSWGTHEYPTYGAAGGKQSVVLLCEALSTRSVGQWE